MSWLLAATALGVFVGLTLYDPLRYGSLEDLTKVPAIIVNGLSALYERLLYAWSRLSVLYAESVLHEWLMHTWMGVLGGVVSLGSIVHHSGLTLLVAVLSLIVAYLHLIEAVPLDYMRRFLWVLFWNYRANFLLRFDEDQDGEATRLYVEHTFEPFTVPLRRFVELCWGLIRLAGTFGYRLSAFVGAGIRMATWGPFIDLIRRLWAQILLEYDRINPLIPVEDTDEEQDSGDEAENDRKEGKLNGSRDKEKHNKKEGGKAGQSKEVKKRNGRKAREQNKGKGGRKR